MSTAKCIPSVYKDFKKYFSANEIKVAKEVTEHVFKAFDEAVPTTQEGKLWLANFISGVEKIKDETNKVDMENLTFCCGNNVNFTVLMKGKYNAILKSYVYNGNIAVNAVDNAKAVKFIIKDVGNVNLINLYFALTLFNVVLKDEKANSAVIEEFKTALQSGNYDSLIDCYFNHEKEFVMYPKVEAYWLHDDEKEQPQPIKFRESWQTEIRNNKKLAAYKILKQKNAVV